uniref:Secreted protein n=1 Tax=Globodera rostochiensis TaxID=31243 RepID=A0A914GVL5_GLORO
MLCFNFNLFLALAATADGQRTECQKNFNATELINSAPNVLNGENAQKWVQKHAFGVLCCKKFEPKFEWADSVEQKNIFKILQKLKSEFCRQLDEGNGMEMAAQKVQNLTRKLAQILEETPKIRENIQKAQENAKNGAKLDKFEAALTSKSAIIAAKPAPRRPPGEDDGG